MRTRKLLAEKRWAVQDLHVCILIIFASFRRRIISDDESDNDLQHTGSTGTMSTVAKTSTDVSFQASVPIRPKGFTSYQTDF